jgi:hypothetical protein
MVQVTATQVAALVDAAPEGVAHAGLRIEPTVADAGTAGDDDREPEQFHVMIDPAVCGDDAGPAGVDRTVPAAELPALLREHPLPVADWVHWQEAAPETEPPRAFLRWLEGMAAGAAVDAVTGGPADGAAGSSPRLAEHYEALASEPVERAWGQLSIRTSLRPNGRRRYALRHRDDVDRAAVELRTLDGPLALRDLADRDADGRYRPLSTAPTLRDGWRLADLDPSAAVRAVDLTYPATIPNWYREARGTLDVTHFADAAERQTGIYDLVEELPREAIEWAASACCVDSQCLKRREWDAAADDALDVPRGEGEFPCREPCSLLIAAARGWTKNEHEPEQTYEFTLTPGEKEQLEDLIDAAADGRTDEIREADVTDGANRYRARYLRAKRMDGAGRLCGVPTERDD